jgi:ABC-type phosphate transport system auxiliary subunit
MWLFSRARRPAPPAGPVLDDLAQRLNRLEAMVEGLQDAVYREARRQDERIEDLRDRTRPERLAKALSDDARDRGL